MSFHIVGTAPESVGPLSFMNRHSGSACRKRSGMNSDGAAHHRGVRRPQALAWNIGTIGSTRSSKSSEAMLPVQTAIECS